MVFVPGESIMMLVALDINRASGVKVYSMVDQEYKEMELSFSAVSVLFRVAMMMQEQGFRSTYLPEEIQKFRDIAFLNSPMGPAYFEPEEHNYNIKLSTFSFNVEKLFKLILPELHRYAEKYYLHPNFIILGGDYVARLLERQEMIPERIRFNFTSINACLELAPDFRGIYVTRVENPGEFK